MSMLKRLSIGISAKNIFTNPLNDTKKYARHKRLDRGMENVYPISSKDYTQAFMSTN